MVGKTLKQIYLANQTKKTFKKNGKKHTHPHLKPPRVRGDFGGVFVSHPPTNPPQFFLGLPPIWGIWVLNPLPGRSWDLNPLEPNEDVVAARKDDLISKWLGTRRDQLKAEEAQEAQAPPKPEPRRFDSMGGSVSFVGGS